PAARQRPLARMAGKARGPPRQHPARPALRVGHQGDRDRRRPAPVERGRAALEGAQAPRRRLAQRLSVAREVQLHGGRSIAARLPSLVGGAGGRMRGSGGRRAVERRRLALAERGVEIALLDWGGDGPLVLMHHANGFCAGTLGLVAEALVPAFRVIGMDARGHGDSTKPEEPEAYSWEAFAL